MAFVVEPYVTLGAVGQRDVFRCAAHFVDDLRKIGTQIVNDAVHLDQQSCLGGSKILLHLRKIIGLIHLCNALIGHLVLGTFRHG